MDLYLPPPAPEETLHSLAVRYHLLSQSATEKISGQRLFGRACPSIAKWSGTGLRRFVERIGRIALLSPEEVMARHTLHSLYRALMAPRPSEISDAPDRWMRSGSLRHRMRYCPACATRDVEIRGFAYYRVYHQAPLVHACAIHGVPLVRYREIDRRPRGGVPSVLPLSEADGWTAETYPISRNPRVERAHRKYARYVRDLVGSAKRAYGLDTIEAAVLCRLGELGIAVSRGRQYVLAALRDILAEVWSDEYLDYVCRHPRRVFGRDVAHDVVLVAGALLEPPHALWMGCDRILGTDVPDGRVPLQRLHALHARIQARDRIRDRLAAHCGPGRLHCRTCIHRDPNLRYLCRDLVPDGTTWSDYSTRLSRAAAPYVPQLWRTEASFRQAYGRASEKRQHPPPNSVLGSQPAGAG
ncbi:TniQ family protein [Deferrisoma palaeochoriense]